MQAVRTSIGGTEVLIESMDNEVEVLGGPPGERATQTTSLADDLRRSYAQAKAVIREIAADVGDEVHKVTAAARPAEVQLEFDLGFSAQLGAWIIAGKGDCALRVTMTWKFSDDA
jgi:hypothetical protein